VLHPSRVSCRKPLTQACTDGLSSALLSKGLDWRRPPGRSLVPSGALARCPCSGAALELGAASSSAQRGAVLNRWLRDGRLPPSTFGFPGWLDLNQTTYAVLPPGPVVLRALREPGTTDLAPVPETGSTTVVRSSWLMYQKARLFPWDPTILPRYLSLSIYALLQAMTHAPHLLPAKNCIPRL
jgi:hypothetical protein